MTHTIRPDLLAWLEAIADYEQRGIDDVLEDMLAAYLLEAPTEEPLTPDEWHTLTTSNEQLSPDEAVARGSIGSWADLGIEDGAAWVNEHQAKRKARRQWLTNIGRSQSRD